MEKLCNSCETACWFTQTSQKNVTEHNEAARKSGLDIVMQFQDLRERDIEKIITTEEQIELLKEEADPNCPQLENENPDFIGRWMIY